MMNRRVYSLIHGYMYEEPGEPEMDACPHHLPLAAPLETRNSGGSCHYGEAPGP